MSLRKKAIIVTGGSRGIGFETCRAIMEMGFSVLATGRTKTSQQLFELEASFKDDRFRYLSVDQLDLETSAKLIYEECIKAFGRIDGMPEPVSLKLTSRSTSICRNRSFCRCFDAAWEIGKD